MRLVTGFADVFAAIVLVGGLIALVGLGASFIGAGSGLLGLVAVWLLAPPLVEQRRFAACAIVLALAFAFMLALPAFSLLSSFGALVVAAGLYFQWQRFRIPLSAALGMGFAAAFLPLFFVGDVGLGPFSPDDPAVVDLFLFNVGGFSALFVGIVLFVIAMRWDLTDRDRVTRRSDVAFWLHLMAGPLIVHGLFSLIGAGRFDADSVNPWPVIILFGLFTLTALVIDRRPLLIASFGYFLFALGQIIYRQVGAAATPELISIPQAIMLAALGGGLLVAILAGAWSPLRRAAIGLLPTATASRLPPVTGQWQPPVPTEDDRAPGEGEPVRLVLGLNDYLATLGLSVLFIGSLVASYVIMADQMRGVADSGHLNAVRRYAELWSGSTPWLALLVPAAVILLAAEIFVRRQRMALTAVVASSQFALVTFFGGLLFLWQQSAAPMIADAIDGRDVGQQALDVTTVVATCMVAALVNWGFGVLNRIPAAAGWGALMLVPLLFVDRIAGLSLESVDQAALPQADVQFRLILFGGIVFAIALALDWSDRARRTQRSDIAFWLHGLASLFAVLILFVQAGQAASPMAATLGLYAVLVVLALVINRRAPLVVGIPFVISVLDFDAAGTMLLVRLIFFAALMALVLGWDRVRTMVQSRLGGASAGA